MKVGIGLPASSPGIQGRLNLDWARQAEAGPFSSLGLVDRIVYPNFEPLITLAAVAGVTTRIRLMTTVLLAPLRGTGILAKQAASLDALSGGRLTLGFGTGGREDDFLAAPASFHDRGKRFDAQLEQLARIWSGQAVSDKIGAIGPAPIQPGGPEVLIGGYGPAAMRRLGRWGNGFISGGSPPEQANQAFRMAEETWRKAARPGTPRLVGCIYFALGPRASEGIEHYISSYYAYMGKDTVRQMVQGFPSTVEAVQAAIKGFSDIGADELMLWPCIPELDQVQRLADLIKS
jgi:alkanesulfonate monooxygenase SsuD/methylene tetrahydromethanopterin reductase-like flavin-dependent oxidoreductase (luciferase family)